MQVKSSLKYMNFLKNAITVSLCTLISRISGFIRDIFFAKYLGTGFFSDVFLTAFKLPNFFRSIFAEGAFNSAFVPVFSSSIIENDKSKSDYFLKNLFSILFYSLLIFTIFIEIFMPFVIKIIAFGFSNDLSKYELSITLSRITFPYLIFISIVSFFSGILNSIGKFTATSLCPVILNIVFVFFAILSGFLNANIAFMLSIAIFVAGILQFLFLLFFTVKSGYIVYPIVPKIDGKLKEFFKIFSSSLAGSGIVQINSMVDAIMATTIVGAVSYIYYADRLVQLPLSLIGTALSISILPALSKVIQLKDNTEIDNIENFSLFIALFIGLPACIGLFTLSDSIISVVYQRGKFNVNDVIAVSRVLKIYSIALPLMILTKIFQTIFYANKDTKTPMMISFCSLCCNIILNIIFIKIFGYIGITISSVVSYFLSVSLLLCFSKKLIHFNDFLKINSLKVVYSSIIMFLVLIFFNKFLLNDIFSKGLLSKILLLGSAIGFSGLIYLTICFVTKAIDLKVIKKLF